MLQSSLTKNFSQGQLLAGNGFFQLYEPKNPNRIWERELPEVLQVSGNKGRARVERPASASTTTSQNNKSSFKKASGSSTNHRAKSTSPTPFLAADPLLELESKIRRLARIDVVAKSDPKIPQKDAPLETSKRRMRAQILV